ncbi:MAG TPA: glycosyltransferase family 39 protein, partial [Chloroflexota bacterium]|nr:glycosyltransferase family 39 protein [Chloroflexota bacterium]
MVGALEAPSPPHIEASGVQARRPGLRLAASSRQMLLLAAVLALAFWLGTHDLAAQSIWPDEGYSWNISGQSLAAITQNTLSDQIHVPGYYFLLHYWMKAAGDSTFTMRLMSVFGAVLTVAALASLVRRLAGFRTGLLASLLAAAHPLLLYYAQEARMYSLLLGAVLIELRLLIMCLDRPTRWRWTAYGCAVAASLYIHYTAVVVLPVCALLPWLLGRKEPRLQVANLAAIGAACTLFAPWALFGIREFDAFAPVTAATVSLGRWLSDFALAFNTGEMTFEIRQQVAATPPPWAFTVFVAALGLLAAWKARSRAVWLALFLIPSAAVIGIALAGRDFAPRYAIAGILGYIPLVALGLGALPGLAVRALATCLVLSGFGWCDWLYFTSPAFQRQDFRGAVADAVQHAAAGDAIVLLNAAPLRPIWRYYAPPGLTPVSLPRPLPTDGAAFDQAMRGAIGSSDHVELMLWQDFGEDPQHRVRQWLEMNGHRVEGWGSGEIAVYGYFMGDPFPPSPPEGLRPVNA